MCISVLLVFSNKNTFDMNISQVFAGYRNDGSNGCLRQLVAMGNFGGWAEQRLFVSHAICRPPPGSLLCRYRLFCRASENNGTQLSTAAGEASRSGSTIDRSINLAVWPHFPAILHLLFQTNTNVGFALACTYFLQLWILGYWALALFVLVSGFVG